MKKLDSTLPNMIISLGVITIIASALLAWANSVTAEPIAAAAKQTRVDAIKDVLPPFDNDPLEKAVELNVMGDGNAPFIIYPAYEGDKFVGAAVEGCTLNGFSGEVKVMYGFDAAGVVHGYQVLSHAETPGLGAKMNEWFRMEEGNRSVIDKDPAQVNMTVAKDGGAIDAITAATISSRAFLSALRDCYQAFVTYKNDHSNE